MFIVFPIGYRCACVASLCVRRLIIPFFIPYAPGVLVVATGSEYQCRHPPLCNDCGNARVKIYIMNIWPNRCSSLFLSPRFQLYIIAEMCFACSLGKGNHVQGVSDIPSVPKGFTKIRNIIVYCPGIFLPCASTTRFFVIFLSSKSFGRQKDSSLPPQNEEQLAGEECG